MSDIPNGAAENAARAIEYQLNREKQLTDALAVFKDLANLGNLAGELQTRVDELKAKAADAEKDLGVKMDAVVAAEKQAADELAKGKDALAQAAAEAEAAHAKQMAAHADELAKALSDHAAATDAAKATLAQVQADVAGVQADLSSHLEARAALESEIAELTGKRDALQAQLAKIAKLAGA